MIFLFVLQQRLLQMIVSSFEEHIDDSVVLQILVLVKMGPDRRSDFADRFIHDIVDHHDAWDFSGLDCFGGGGFQKTRVREQMQTSVPVGPCVGAFPQPMSSDSVSTFKTLSSQLYSPYDLLVEQCRSVGHHDLPSGGSQLHRRHGRCWSVVIALQY
jgi:hypothetical protein